LHSDLSDGEYTNTNTLKSFDTNGFSVGNSGATGASSSTYVAWNWKAGGAGSSNPTGTISSTISANSDAGFSIISYTGTGSSGTLGHGLSGTPDMTIVKSRDGNDQWIVQTPDMNTSGHSLRLMDTSAKQGASSGELMTYQATTLTNNGSWGGNNTNGVAYIAYVFKSVDGYSKFGSYVGNSSADGTFVYCGFRPAYVMFKRTSGAERWNIFDADRSGYNLVDDFLAADTSNAENVNHTGIRMDFTSNGFKIRGTNTGINTSGATYIFLAFAEMPFKHSNAR
jgi:hypothetical protein